MVPIKRLYTGIVIIGLVAMLGVTSLWAQTIQVQIPTPGQPPPPVNFSYFDNQHLMLKSPSTVMYRRSAGLAGSWVPKGGPGLGFGQPTPSATLDAVSNIKITGTVLYGLSNPGVETRTQAINSNGTVTIKLVSSNVGIVTINATSASLSVALVVTISTRNASARAMMVKVNYATNDLSSLTIAVKGQSGRVVRVLWPNADQPVFTKKVGKSDWIYLYWTGPNWPSTSVGVTNGLGEIYGIVSFNH